MTHSKNSYNGSLDTLQLLLFGLWRDIRSRFAHKNSSGTTSGASPINRRDFRTGSNEIASSFSFALAFFFFVCLSNSLLI